MQMLTIFGQKLEHIQLRVGSMSKTEKHTDANRFAVKNWDARKCQSVSDQKLHPRSMGLRPSTPAIQPPSIPCESQPQPRPRSDTRERTRTPLAVDSSFIPETIDDPAPGEPCGLYLDGLNFHWDRERTEKMMTRAGIKSTRVVKKKSDTWCVLYFDNNADRRAAYAALLDRASLPRVLWVVPLRRDTRVCERMCHRLRARATSDLRTRTVNDRVAPWSAMPYEEQLSRKSAKYSELLRPILPDSPPPLVVFPAPKTAGFRNKAELTFGFDLEDRLTVGYNLGSKVEDVVVPITDCVTVSETMVALAERLRRFALSSGLPVFDRVTNVGVWKFVLIRTTELEQVLMAVCTFEALPEETVAAFVQEFAGDVTSLYYIQSRALEGWGRAPTLHHLSGPEFVVERLRGLNFDISPLSFFQCNTTGAELLFERIEELAQVDGDTVLIDCCCGTGVIGLAMARSAKEVIGIDIEEEAIADAKRNAEKNGIANASFIAGKAEEVLPQVLATKAGEGAKIVCVVDPPREGLHKSALTAIRECCLLRRLVYVSCAPDSLVRDTERTLTKESRNWSMRKFTPVSWFGVDMFPHTDRCEVVMLFER
jgi:tRNA (uracil-5-)-methyltransferase